MWVDRRSRTGLFVNSDTGSAVAQSLEITDPEALATFAKVLLDASDKLGALPSTINASHVNSEAFGKLLEAQNVATAYAQRLPSTEDNLKVAAEAAEQLAAELTQAQRGYEQTEQSNAGQITSAGQGL